MIINYQDFPKIREQYKDKKIVYSTGTFDLTHLGHVVFFEHCKNLGDILVVGVGMDILLKQQKDPNRPIINERARLRMVDSLKPVDYSFQIDQKVWKGKDTHREMMMPVFKMLKPDFFVINEEGGDIDERKKLCEEAGVKLIILPRDPPSEFEGISTTKIIDKIKELQ